MILVHSIQYKDTHHTFNCVVGIFVHVLFYFLIIEYTLQPG